MVQRRFEPRYSNVRCNGLLDVKRNSDLIRKLVEIDRACRVDLDEHTYTERQPVHQVS